MVGVLLLSNFENRLYADENGETSHESAEIVTEISEPSTDEGSTDSDTAEPSANEESSDTAEESSETSNEGQISESTDEQTDLTEVAEPTSDGESTDSNNTEPSANEESSDPIEESSENSSEDQTNNQVEKTEPTENTSGEPTNTNANESTEKEENSDLSSDTTFDNDVRSSLKASVMRKNTPMLRGASTFTYGTIEITRPENYAGTGPASFVIMDRNLGATSNDITSPDSYGYHFQWGNNHGFPSDGSEITTGSEQVDASSYGPRKPYSSDTFISGKPDWSSVKNDNLR